MLGMNSGNFLCTIYDAMAAAGALGVHVTRVRVCVFRCLQHVWLKGTSPRVRALGTRHFKDLCCDVRELAPSSSNLNSCPGLGVLCLFVCA